MSSHSRLSQMTTAAIEGFVRRGYHGFSMKMCGNAVRLTKGSLYHHVKDKLDLAHLAIDSAGQAIYQLLAQFKKSDNTDDFFEKTINVQKNVFNALLPTVLVEADDAALTDKAREMLKTIKLQLHDAKPPSLKPYQNDIVYFAWLGLCLHQRVFRAPDNDALRAKQEAS